MHRETIQFLTDLYGRNTTNTSALGFPSEEAKKFALAGEYCHLKGWAAELQLYCGRIGWAPDGELIIPQVLISAKTDKLSPGKTVFSPYDSPKGRPQRWRNMRDNIENAADTVCKFFERATRTRAIRVGTEISPRELTCHEVASVFLPIELDFVVDHFKDADQFRHFLMVLFGMVEFKDGVIPCPLCNDGFAPRPLSVYCTETTESSHVYGACPNGEIWIENDSERHDSYDGWLECEKCNAGFMMPVGPTVNWAYPPDDLIPDEWARWLPHQAKVAQPKPSSNSGPIDPDAF